MEQTENLVGHVPRYPPGSYAYAHGHIPILKYLQNTVNIY